MDLNDMTIKDLSVEQTDQRSESKRFSKRTRRCVTYLAISTTLIQLLSFVTFLTAIRPLGLFFWGMITIVLYLCYVLINHLVICKSVKHSILLLLELFLMLMFITLFLMTD